MKEKKVIVCEKCFNIPKITIKNKNVIQLECQNCNSNSFSPIDYFDKFININEKDDLLTLPNCNFKDHLEQAVLYCFKCSKYLCKECLKNHDEIFKDKGHYTIKQKINHKYFCDMKGHEENILNRFCSKCNKYLCCDCKCQHIGNNIYNFDNIDNKIKIIKDNISKCQDIIDKEEINCKNFIEKLENKIKTLKNLFKDYKKRNTDLITFYNLLIDNYEQIKNIKNYNIRNNLLLNNNFDLRNSQIYEDECLISNYNKLTEFYRNTNHIKTQEYINYYITPKFCNSEIKKILILNENIVCFMFNKKNYLCFTYKNKNSENTIKRYYNYFIKNIYPLSDNKLIYLDEKNILYIDQITIDNSLNSSALLSLENIQFSVIDIYNKENFFTISNMVENKFFILDYYMNDKNKIDNKTYEINKYLILKENKKIHNGLFENITKIINDSNIDKKEKVSLNLIFKNENEANIHKLIDSNNKFLNFIDTMNNNIYNKLKEKIKIKEKKYKINSNYLMKYLPNINKDNLNQNEINEINNICNINSICKKIMEVYIGYLIFNTKINNIYNYQNKFLFFMGEKYLFIAFSLKTKEFLGFESSNLIKNDFENYNNYEIIKIISNKILINNNNNKIINIIEYDSNYNFCLVKNSFKYNSNAIADINYLLFDSIENNTLNFSLINLDTYNVENNFVYDFCGLLNFKIDNKPPKLYLTDNFSKFIYLYEDNNQISIINLKINNQLEQKNQIELNNKIVLKKDNEEEIIPSIYQFFSVYSNEYIAENVLKEEGYFCTKTNMKEFISFKFDKEYCFKRIDITFPDSYGKARVKDFNINIYDINGKCINIYNFCNNDYEKKQISVILNDKGAFLKFELSTNFGEDYFCIKRIQFFTEITYSLN